MRITLNIKDELLAKAQRVSGVKEEPQSGFVAVAKSSCSSGCHRYRAADPAEVIRCEVIRRDKSAPYNRVLQLCSSPSQTIGVASAQQLGVS